MTNVARASLEELRLDYEDFLRQRGHPQWARQDRRRADLIARRPSTADEVADWVRETRERELHEDGRDGHSGHRGRSSISSTQSTSSTAPSYAEIAANGALVLIAVACSLLDRQLTALAAKFEEEGGFTERLYQRRQRTRHGHRP